VGPCGGWHSSSCSSLDFIPQKKRCGPGLLQRLFGALFLNSFVIGLPATGLHWTHFAPTILMSLTHSQPKLS
jgi:hypothetical protein